jgi:hypothetical protein
VTRCCGGWSCSERARAEAAGGRRRDGASVSLHTLIAIVLVVICYNRPFGGSLGKNLLFFTPLACIGVARSVFEAENPVVHPILLVAAFAIGFVVVAVLGDRATRRFNSGEESGS